MTTYESLVIATVVVTLRCVIAELTDAQTVDFSDLFGFLAMYAFRVNAAINLQTKKYVVLLKQKTNRWA